MTYKLSHVVIGFFVGIVFGMFFAGHLWVAYATNSSAWFVQHGEDE